jgi:hypothetical protein
MKRFIFFSILIFLFGYKIFASDNKNITFDISLANINLFNLDEELISPSESMSIASTMLSLSLGLGYHLNIIPNVFLPGIYVDGGIGYLSLIAGSLNDPDDYDNETFGGWIGIRLYNRFKLNLIDIQPFAGLSLYGFSGMKLPATTFGALFAYKYYGIEYSFHLPLLNAEKIFYIHRISFIFHLS